MFQESIEPQIDFFFSSALTAPRSRHNLMLPFCPPIWLHSLLAVPWWNHPICWCWYLSTCHCPLYLCSYLIFWLPFWQTLIQCLDHHIKGDPSHSHPHNKVWQQKKVTFASSIVIQQHSYGKWKEFPGGILVTCCIALSQFYYSVVCNTVRKLSK